MDLITKKETFSRGASPTLFGSPTESYGIVVFSHLRWKFVWQRPQQFLSRFADNHPVLFMELTEFDLGDEDEPVLELETVAPNVTMAKLHLPGRLQGKPEVNDLMRTYCQIAIEAANAKGDFDRPLLWFYSPMDATWALGLVEARGIVYDCMDELSQFRDAPPELASRERLLLQNADIVFTGGYELFLKKSRQHANVHFFGCGVEYDHFARAQVKGDRPDDLKNVDGPIIGWYGVIDERVDYDLLATVAEIRPNYNFVMVGPFVKVDPAGLPKADNIHWMGARDYKELPNYCRTFDVCMMCFALNEATQYINPTKALEYLATGKPVISTPVADVVRQYSDAVYIASGPLAFAETIDSVLASPQEAMRATGLRMAQDAGWECTVAKMQSLIDESIGARSHAFVS